MYRVEIYDMFNETFVDAFMLDKSTELTTDYINPQVYDISAPPDITASYRNTVRIFEESATRATGYITNIRRLKSETVLTIAPIMMLLNTTSLQNTAYTAWASQIGNQIYWDFSSSNPSQYHIPWLTYSDMPASNWDNVQVPYGNELRNDMECVQLARQTRGKFMSFGLSNNMSHLGVPCVGYRKFTTTKVIEADLDNVIDKDINETRLGGKNILIVWTPNDDFTGWVWYTALLINGTYYTNGSLKNTIDDPRVVTLVYEDENPIGSGKVSLLDLAKQNLKATEDTLEISLTFKRDDKIVSPVGRRLGEPTDIISGGKTYHTYLTGITYRRDTVTLMYGMVRQALTAQLNREER